MKMLNRMMKTLQEMNITYQETEVLISCKKNSNFEQWLEGSTAANVS